MRTAILLLALAFACVFADVVDNEAIGTPNYGRMSKTGCLRWINWSNQPPPTGTWSNGHVVAPACEYGPVAATRGWYYNNTFSAQTPIPLSVDGVLSQTEGLKERVREALRNAKRIARNYGADYDDFARTQFAVYDIEIMRPIVNTVQAEPEFWGLQTAWTVPAYPNRGIIGHKNFNGLDCITPSGTIYRGVNNAATGQVDCAAGDFAVGDVVEIDVLFVHRRGTDPDFPRRD